MVCCPFCEFSACSACNQTFLCMETTTVPKCMSPECGKEWSRQFMAKTFTAKFMTKTLKEHRENVLLSRERALLPATQPHVEARIRNDRMREELNEIQTQMKVLAIRKRNLQLAISRGCDVNDLGDAGRAAADAGRSRKTLYVRKCPSEECRGFLSNQWKCGLCEKHTCCHCHMIKNEADGVEHVCNPDDVATATLLAQDTKPCPGCSTGIFKIHGCDQMFCTQCQTAFSWTTGAIETRHIHNPHYFEAMRAGVLAGGGAPRRNPMEIRCGRELDRYFIRNTVGLFLKMPTTQMRNSVSNNFTSIVQKVMHYRYSVIPTYRVDDIEDNMEIRIKYLKNEITEDKFKTIIQRENKKREKKREIGDVLRMYVDTATDIMYRYAHVLRDYTTDIQFTEADKALETEMNALCEYTTGILQDISKTYGCKPVTIVVVDPV